MFNRKIPVLFAALAAVVLYLGQAAAGEGYVNVRDFIAAGETDHTMAVRRALQEAAKNRSYALLFPPGRYLISDTIDIGAANEIVGRGYAAIVQQRPEKDIFFTDNKWRITVKGLTFEGGRDQLALGNKNINVGFMIVSDCRFNNAAGAAVRFLHRDPKETSSTFCLVEKSVFNRCLQTAIFVSDQSHLSDCWISTTRERSNLAVLENHGVLTCRNIVGVPNVSGTDQRWIDNYGTLSVRNFRFGGEGGGFTPVVNRARRAPGLWGLSVLIEDSFIAALGNNKRPCAVYLEEIPNQLVIRDCVLTGVPAVMVDKKIDLKTYFDGVRPGMLRFDVENNLGEFAGSLPDEMIKAASSRKSGVFEYGTAQLSAGETKEALAKAVRASKGIPSALPGSMSYGLKAGETGHRQQTDLKEYVDITLDTHTWDLEDYLDGTLEKASSYLSLAEAGDDIVIMSRMDKPSYPHVRIRNVHVDLERTPWLAWRIKDNGLKGGHHAVRLINNATGESVKLVDIRGNDQFDYTAFDLRRALDREKGEVDIDIKFYFMGVRYIDSINRTYAGRGDFFLLDFIRLETENKAGKVR